MRNKKVLTVVVGIQARLEWVPLSSTLFGRASNRRMTQEKLGCEGFQEVESHKKCVI